MSKMRDCANSHGCDINNEGHLSKRLGIFYLELLIQNCYQEHQAVFKTLLWGLQGAWLKRADIDVYVSQGRNFELRQNKRTHHRGYWVSNIWNESVGIQRQDNPCWMDGFRKDGGRRCVWAVHRSLENFWMNKMMGPPAKTWEEHIKGTTKRIKDSFNVVLGKQQGMQLDG